MNECGAVEVEEARDTELIGFLGGTGFVGDLAGRDESKRQGLNLSGSWQQGHSATYNTPSRI